jgi:hypothetical protein
MSVILLEGINASSSKILKGFFVSRKLDKNTSQRILVFKPRNLDWKMPFKNSTKWDLFGFFAYVIQHCFICRPSDSTVSEDAEVEPRTVVTSTLAVRRSNHSARSHPPFGWISSTIQLHLIHSRIPSLVTCSEMEFFNGIFNLGSGHKL